MSRSPSAPLVASFGLVDPVKRVDTLIEALPSIRDRHPGTRLVLVGPVTPDYSRDLHHLARRLGVGDALTITGAVEDEVYGRWMALADVAVQLRAMSQGEASLTVAEALGAGLPTVVTRAGWMAEIPEGVVTGVAPGADATDIATAIGTILDDPARWRALRNRGRRWAVRNGFGHVADALLRTLAIAHSRGPTRTG